ncbi:MAG: HupE/UreJ family protein [Burkholderiaceae bacterium]|nr:HupE/UreJ family protein [Burkholderiaceae bacterium]
MNSFVERLLLCSALLLPAGAWAHKASDAYLQLAVTEQGLNLRIDIALRDLDAALDLDADGDGRLTWGEVRAAWPAIDAYVGARLQVQGCELAPGGHALEKRADGVYAALSLQSPCQPSELPMIRYTVMQEVDPTHRGLARITLGSSRPELRVLDPLHPAVWPATTAPTSTTGQATQAPASASAATAASETLDTSFLREGVHHIITGYDHVLFLLCLLLPAVMRRTPQGWRPVDELKQAVWPVVGIVTAFTLAHSITLTLAALKLASIPSAIIEPAIAATIVLAAIDNLRPLFFRLPRAAVTFAFGLIHGFGFAGVLAEMDLPTSTFAWALLQFNLGLELGQLAIVLAVVSLLYLLRRRAAYPRWVIGGGSMAAIMVGSLWFVERTADVSVLGF